VAYAVSTKLNVNVFNTVFRIMCTVYNTKINASLVSYRSQVPQYGLRDYHNSRGFACIRSLMIFAGCKET